MVSCDPVSPGSSPSEFEEFSYGLTDPSATSETVALYRKLSSLTTYGSGMMFGHQASNIQGIHFKKPDMKTIQSDVLESVGYLPAVFGFDFNRGFEVLLPAVIQAAEAGGIITISYHMKYPGTRSYHYKDIINLTDDPVAEVLPGGKYHTAFLNNLDKVADFADKALCDGKHIPILFRPWHEHTGAWFWWGIEACSEEQFVALWKFTVSYLRDIRGVHNLLYVFSPSRPAEHGSYTFRNPGPDQFDVAGFDCYVSSRVDMPGFMKNAEMTAQYAAVNGKIPAISEFGFRHGIGNCPEHNWYSGQFLAPLAQKGYTTSFAYCMTWQNSADSYWVPLPGDPHHPDFVLFQQSDEVHFLGER